MLPAKIWKRGGIFLKLVELSTTPGTSLTSLNICHLLSFCLITLYKQLYPYIVSNLYTNTLKQWDTDVIDPSQKNMTCSSLFFLIAPFFCHATTNAILVSLYKIQFIKPPHSTLRSVVKYHNRLTLSRKTKKRKLCHARFLSWVSRKSFAQKNNQPAHEFIISALKSENTNSKVYKEV